MPPSYVNVGAWVGDGTMVDSHVLVGSCAQIGDAGPSRGRRDDRRRARAGRRAAGHRRGRRVRRAPASALLEGVLVGRGAVIGAGVVLTGTSRCTTWSARRVLVGTADRAARRPAGRGRRSRARPLPGEWARSHGLAIATALLVKDRDPGTDARVALEAALR